MKKVFNIFSLSLISLLLIASISYAVPVYTGPTNGNWGTGGVPPLPQDTGYYIWSNNADLTSWSVRWTGNNDGQTANWNEWLGFLDFDGLTVTNVTPVMWEQGQDPLLTNTTNQIQYEAAAGPSYDGFDFTIVRGATTGTITFTLGTMPYQNYEFIFSDMDIGTEQQATRIWIGQNFNEPTVDVIQITTGGGGGNVLPGGGAGNNGRTYLAQRFEIRIPGNNNNPTPTPSVPEPATAVMFGLGLIGLVGLYRKK